MFGLKYRYLIIVALGFYSYINTYFTDFFNHYQVKASTEALILSFILIVFFVWELSRLAELTLKRYFKTPSAVKFLALLFVLSLPLTFISAIAVIAIAGIWYSGYQPTEIQTEIKLTLLLAFRINLFLHCINSITYFFKQLRAKQLEAEELKRAQIQAQLQQIKTQINPHFLFNNLNVLASLIMNKSEEANQFIESFSEVYRYILKNQEKELVSLQDELKVMDLYVFLLKKRFAEAIKFNISFDEHRLENTYIVPATLQILIENAIKHNIASSAKPLCIDIVIENDTMMVRNNYQPKQILEKSSQIGLKSINQQYKIICGKEITVKNQDDYFEITLPVLKVENYEVFNH
jgi:sensor histidine kinase YesM